MSDPELLFNKIVIVGAGTMGRGIAQVCAMAGYTTILNDISEDTLTAAHKQILKNLAKGVEKGKVSAETHQKALNNLSLSQDLVGSIDNADMVIEAVPELMELKKKLLNIIDEHSPEHCIIGTNTSSLSIEELAESTSDASRVIGMHFFNPVHIMQLLEIVYAPNLTGNDVIAATEDFAKSIGKTSILVKNAPGFATSRLGIALGMEAIRMLEEGVASAEDIDTAMVLGYKHPIGPLRLTDLVGLDVRMNIGTYLAEQLNNPAFEPPKLLKSLVDQGKLGKKSGEGFYRW
jgi:3-hydroxybutyryl-CoA dehydrogenase